LSEAVGGHLARVVTGYDREKPGLELHEWESVRASRPRVEVNPETPRTHA
jgi:hypothetical protein